MMWKGKFFNKFLFINPEIENIASKGHTNGLFMSRLNIIADKSGELLSTFMPSRIEGFL
jgi:hypothetical protein